MTDEKTKAINEIGRITDLIKGLKRLDYSVTTKKIGVNTKGEDVFRLKLCSEFWLESEDQILTDIEKNFLDMMDSIKSDIKKYYNDSLNNLLGLASSMVDPPESEEPINPPAEPT